jgi:hypothetical protein
MGTQYPGNPAAFPVDFFIPDDSDDRDAATTNVALEALGDRTAWLAKSMLVPVGVAGLASLAGTVLTSLVKTDIPGFFATVPSMKVGDKIVMNMSLFVNTGDNCGIEIWPIVEDDVGPTDVGYHVIDPGLIRYHSIAFTYVWTAVATGPVTLKAAYKLGAVTNPTRVGALSGGQATTAAISLMALRQGALA